MSKTAEETRYVARRLLSQKATGRFVQPGEAFTPVDNTPDEVQMLLDMGVIEVGLPDEQPEEA